MSRQDIKLSTSLNAGTFAYGTLTAVHNHDVMDRYTAHFVFADATPAAGTFTAAVTDIITKAGHLYQLGLKVRLTTTTTLPAGLALSTDYFVVPIDANTFKLSDTLAHAIAGTNLKDITDTGTGVHTITPTALAGFEAHINYSLDGVSYYPLAASTVTAMSFALQNYSGVSYPFLVCDNTLTAGQVTGTVKFRSAGLV